MLPHLDGKMLFAWLKKIHQLENILLVIFVFALIVLASMQMVARNFFSAGFLWVDPAAKMLVLWSGLLGAMIAARDGKHISLDVLMRMLSGWKLQLARLISFGFAAVICGMLAWYAVGLIQLDYALKTIGVGQVPAWWLELILPIAFGVMAIRFAIYMVLIPETSADITN